MAGQFVSTRSQPRHNIGFVPRKLFSSAKPSASHLECRGERRKVQWAAEAGHRQRIEGFPEQYKTLVGERGITLRRAETTHA
jgi:ABC-type transport system involved in Fe-S cluster assembly fused permease/ATPase subunit